MSVVHAVPAKPQRLAAALRSAASAAQLLSQVSSSLVYLLFVHQCIENCVKNCNELYDKVFPVFEIDFLGLLRRPCAWYCLPCLSKNWYFEVGLACLCGYLCVTCYYALVLPIHEYCSLVWESAAECHLQLLKRQVYLGARLCPDQTFLSSCHRHHVAT